LKKLLWVFLSVLLACITGLIVWILLNIRDRHPNHQIDISIKNEQPQILQAGFSAFPITPQVIDTWNDVNGDARYKPDDGDAYNDNNQNGKFDAVWIAGFHQARPAQGVHDDLWSRAIVIHDGKSTIAIVSLDAIGFMQDDIIDIRKKVAEDVQVDYIIINSTHDHEAPDLQGIWGESPFKSGVDPDYMQYVKSQTVKAIIEAYERQQSVKLRFAQTDASYLVQDTRLPQVLDSDIRLMQAVSTETHQTIGTLVTWGNHPETLWSRNLLISSDFPHYFREGVEKGVFLNDSLLASGLGGISVFINGAIGGLMTTHPSMNIPSLQGDTSYIIPSYDKIKAQGDQLALLALKALADSGTVVEVEKASINLVAKSVIIPLSNPKFRLAAFFGIIDRGFTGWMKIRTEIAAWTLGPASFVSIPGEIYPEIVNGGVEAPFGQDFSMQPLEIPPLRERMPGQFKFIFGLSNDQIGYIIPKSEWDEEPPYLYDAAKSPYGETNSVGPETAPLLYSAIIDALQLLNGG